MPTMPGAKPPRVPEGLRDLMKNLAKEVLREKPPDIYTFSARYFETMLVEKKDFDFHGYEVISDYETIFKQGTTRESHQVPLALVYAIIPDELTALIKEFIKAVLRANPNNICEFAVEYFRKLLQQRHQQYGTVQYTAYENYLKSTQRFLYTPYVKCVCGRLLGEGLVRGSAHQEERTEVHYKETTSLVVNGVGMQGSKIARSTLKKTTSKERQVQRNKLPSEDEKLINAVHVIQRFFRRSLAKKRVANGDKEVALKKEKQSNCIMSEETAALVIQRTIRKIFSKETEIQIGEKAVPPLKLETTPKSNEDNNDNVSEAASYTSASTALVSATSTADSTEMGNRNNAETEIELQHNVEAEVETQSEKAMEAMMKMTDLSEKSLDILKEVELREKREIKEDLEKDNGDETEMDEHSSNLKTENDLESEMKAKHEEGEEGQTDDVKNIEKSKEESELHGEKVTKDTAGPEDVIKETNNETGVDIKTVEHVTEEDTTAKVDQIDEEQTNVSIPEETVEKQLLLESKVSEELESDIQDKNEEKQEKLMLDESIEKDKESVERSSANVYEVDEKSNFQGKEADEQKNNVPAKDTAEENIEVMESPNDAVSEIKKLESFIEDQKTNEQEEKIPAEDNEEKNKDSNEGPNDKVNEEEVDSIKLERKTSEAGKLTGDKAEENNFGQERPTGEIMKSTDKPSENGVENEANKEEIVMDVRESTALASNEEMDAVKNEDNEKSNVDSQESFKSGQSDEKIAKEEVESKNEDDCNVNQKLSEIDEAFSPIFKTESVESEENKNEQGTETNNDDVPLSQKQNSEESEMEKPQKSPSKEVTEDIESLEKKQSSEEPPVEPQNEAMQLGSANDIKMQTKLEKENEGVKILEKLESTQPVEEIEITVQEPVIKGTQLIGNASVEGHDSQEKSIIPEEKGDTPNVNSQGTYLPPTATDIEDSQSDNLANTDQVMSNQNLIDATQQFLEREKVFIATKSTNDEASPVEELDQNNSEKTMKNQSDSVDGLQEFLDNEKHFTSLTASVPKVEELLPETQEIEDEVDEAIIQKDSSGVHHLTKTLSNIMEATTEEPLHQDSVEEESDEKSSLKTEEEKQQLTIGTRSVDEQVEDVTNDSMEMVEAERLSAEAKVKEKLTGDEATDLENSVKEAMKQDGVEPEADKINESSLKSQKEISKDAESPKKISESEAENSQSMDALSSNDNDDTTADKSNLHEESVSQNDSKEEEQNVTTSENVKEPVTSDSVNENYADEGQVVGNRNESNDDITEREAHGIKKRETIQAKSLEEEALEENHIIEKSAVEQEESKANAALAKQTSELPSDSMENVLTTDQSKEIVGELKAEPNVKEKAETVNEPSLEKETPVVEEKMNKIESVEEAGKAETTSKLSEQMEDQLTTENSDKDTSEPLIHAHVNDIHESVEKTSSDMPESTAEDNKKASSLAKDHSQSSADELELKPHATDNDVIVEKSQSRKTTLEIEDSDSMQKELTADHSESRSTELESEPHMTEPTNAEENGTELENSKSSSTLAKQTSREQPDAKEDSKDIEDDSQKQEIETISNKDVAEDKKKEQRDKQTREINDTTKEEPTASKLSSDQSEQGENIDTKTVVAFIEGDTSKPIDEEQITATAATEQRSAKSSVENDKNVTEKEDEPISDDAESSEHKTDPNPITKANEANNVEIKNDKNLKKLTRQKSSLDRSSLSGQSSFSDNGDKKPNLQALDEVADSESEIAKENINGKAVESSKNTESIETKDDFKASLNASTESGDLINMTNTFLDKEKTLTLYLNQLQASQDNESENMKVGAGFTETESEKTAALDEDNKIDRQDHKEIDNEKSINEREESQSDEIAQPKDNETGKDSMDKEKSDVTDAPVLDKTFVKSAASPDGHVTTEVIEAKPPIGNLTTDPSIGTQNSHETSSDTSSSNNNKVDNSKNVKKSKSSTKDTSKPVKEHFIGRPLDAVRIAELHLKSFRTADTVPWYETLAPDEPDNDTNIKAESTTALATKIPVVTAAQETPLKDKSKAGKRDVLDDSGFKDMDELAVEKESESPVKTPTVEKERRPTYLIGIPEPAEGQNQGKKVYKKPTAFTIPLDGSIEIESESEDLSETEAASVKNRQLDYTTEQLDLISPTKLFAEIDANESLNYGLDATYTIEELDRISPSIRALIQQNAQADAAQSEAQLSDELRPAEQVLDTIIELNEVDNNANEIVDSETDNSSIALVSANADDAILESRKKRSTIEEQNDTAEHESIKDGTYEINQDQLGNKNEEAEVTQSDVDKSDKALENTKTKKELNENEGEITGQEKGLGRIESAKDLKEIDSHEELKETNDLIDNLEEDTATFSLKDPIDNVESAGKQKDDGTVSDPSKQFSENIITDQSTITSDAYIPESDHLPKVDDKTYTKKDFETAAKSISDNDISKQVEENTEKEINDPKVEEEPLEKLITPTELSSDKINEIKTDTGLDLHYPETTSTKEIGESSDTNKSKNEATPISNMAKTKETQDSKSKEIEKPLTNQSFRKASDLEAVSDDIKSKTENMESPESPEESIDSVIVADSIPDQPSDKADKLITSRDMNDEADQKDLKSVASVDDFHVMKETRSQINDTKASTEDQMTKTEPKTEGKNKELQENFLEESTLEKTFKAQSEDKDESKENSVTGPENKPSKDEIKLQDKSMDNSDEEERTEPSKEVVVKRIVSPIETTKTLQHTEVITEKNDQDNSSNNLNGISGYDERKQSEPLIESTKETSNTEKAHRDKEKDNLEDEEPIQEVVVKRLVTPIESQISLIRDRNLNDESTQKLEHLDTDEEKESEESLNTADKEQKSMESVEKGKSEEASTAQSFTKKEEYIKESADPMVSNDNEVLQEDKGSSEDFEDLLLSKIHSDKGVTREDSNTINESVKTPTEEETLKHINQLIKDEKGDETDNKNSSMESKEHKEVTDRPKEGSSDENSNKMNDDMNNKIEESEEGLNKDKVVLEHKNSTEDIKNIDESSTNAENSKNNEANTENFEFVVEESKAQLGSEEDVSLKEPASADDSELERKHIDTLTKVKEEDNNQSSKKSAKREAIEEHPKEILIDKSLIAEGDEEHIKKSSTSIKSKAKGISTDNEEEETLEPRENLENAVEQTQDEEGSKNESISSTVVSTRDLENAKLSKALENTQEQNTDQEDSENESSSSTEVSPVTKDFENAASPKILENVEEQNAHERDPKNDSTSSAVVSPVTPELEYARPQKVLEDEHEQNTDEDSSSNESISSAEVSPVTSVKNFSKDYTTSSNDFEKLMRQAPSPPTHDPDSEDEKIKSSSSLNEKIEEEGTELGKIQRSEDEPEGNQSEAVKTTEAKQEVTERKEKKEKEDIQKATMAAPSSQIHDEAAKIIQKAYRQHLAKKREVKDSGLSDDNSWNSSQTTQLYVDNEREKSLEDAQSILSAEVANEEGVTASENLGSMEKATKEDDDDERKEKVNWFVGTEPIETSQASQDDEVLLPPDLSSTVVLSRSSVDAEHNELDDTTPTLVSASSKSLDSVLVDDDHDDDEDDGSDLRKNSTLHEENNTVKLVSAEGDSVDQVGKDQEAKVKDGKQEGEDSRDLKEEAQPIERISDVLKPLASSASVEKGPRSVREEENISNLDETTTIKTFTVVEIISKFIIAERDHHNKFYSKMQSEETTTENILDIAKEYLDSQKDTTETPIPYERLEERCHKRKVSLTYIIGDEEGAEDVPSNDASTDQETETSTETTPDDTLNKMAEKLRETDKFIEKMQQRRASKTSASSLEGKPSRGASFEEPVIRTMQDLQSSAITSPELEDDMVVVERLQSEGTRESTAQSDYVVFGPSEEPASATAKSEIKRSHTIAGGDSKTLLKSVTIDEDIKYIEPQDMGISTTSSSSLCLDDDTSENIRQKMMAYSLSEADSDNFGYDASDGELLAKMGRADFNVSTALVDVTGTSTETESTIVSAANKSRMGTAAGDTISESLERLVEEEAAKKIQKAYRQHYQQRKLHEGSTQTLNYDNSLAARRMTLQRGDALRNDSTPDEENMGPGSSEDNGRKNKANDAKVKKKNDRGNDGAVTAKMETAQKSTTREVAVERTKKIIDNQKKWLAMRQHSMPVQIDSEVLRIIPKHMRKRIKSAEGEKKGRRRILKD